MDLTRYEAAAQLVRSARDSKLKLSDLERQLADLVWGVWPDDDPNLLGLAGPVLLLLAERDAGHRSEASVLHELDELTRAPTVVAGERPTVRSGASGRVIHDHLEIAPAQRVDLEQLRVKAS